LLLLFISLSTQSGNFWIHPRKSPGIDGIPAEMIQAGGNMLRLEIHKLNSVY